MTATRTARGRRWGLPLASLLALVVVCGAYVNLAPLKVHVVTSGYVRWLSIVHEPESFVSPNKLFVYIIVPSFFKFFRISFPVKYIFKLT